MKRQNRVLAEKKRHIYSYFIQLIMKNNNTSDENGNEQKNDEQKIPKKQQNTHTLRRKFEKERKNLIIHNHTQQFASIYTHFSFSHIFDNVLLYFAVSNIYFFHCVLFRHCVIIWVSVISSTTLLLFVIIQFIELYILPHILTNFINTFFSKKKNERALSADVKRFILVVMVFTVRFYCCSEFFSFHFSSKNTYP